MVCELQVEVKIDLVKSSVFSSFIDNSEEELKFLPLHLPFTSLKPSGQLQIAFFFTLHVSSYLKVQFAPLPQSHAVIK